MDPRLSELLRLTKVEDQSSRGSSDGQNYTHVTTYGPHSRWTIKSSKLTEFWHGYCDLVYQGTGNYCLAERPIEHMPVIVDCIFKFSLEDPKAELYGEDFILALVYCYQQALIESLQLSDTLTELMCVVLEAERTWLQDGFVVTQLRLQFPYCIVEVPVQIRTIRPKAIQLLRSHDVISRFRPSVAPTQDWEVMIDPIGPQEPVLMYKSTAQPGRPKLILNHMYGAIKPENIETQTGPMQELPDVFSPGNHSHVRKGLVSASLFANNHDLEYWLPLFLSIHYWEPVSQPKHMADTTPIKIISPKLMTPTQNSTPVTEASFIEMSEQLLPMLNRQRVENDHYWLDIGKALYTCDYGGENGLNAWIRFTERSDVHSEEDCRQLYYGFRDNNLSIKTIAWYARQDSPEAYEEWHKQWYAPAMEQATSCLHTDIALALYRVYWLEYVCTRMKPATWYHYRNHRWVIQDNGVALRKTISDDFLRRYERLRTYISQKGQEATDDGTRQSCEIMIKKITTLIAKLKTYSFKTNVMHEAMELFHDDRFEQIVNTNPELLGMLDCVIEVCGTRAYARPGKPEDYVSLCTGLPYLKDLTWESDLVQRLMRWMRQVFVDESLRDYFLKMSASCLKGRNSDKIFPIWTGDGNNSKSMIVKLFEACFGTYCIKFPTSVITGKRTQSSAPMPEMARAKSTRIAIIQEPDDDEVIRGGMLKELTGGDSFFARALHDNGGDVQAMFKLILMCNKIPPIPTGGKAVKNRTRILPFMSTWVHNAPDDEAEQYSRRLFKMDPFFEKQIPNLAKAFMWVMVQYYPRYMNEGLAEPPIIQDHTRQYWQDNDIYQLFINDCLVPVYIVENGQQTDRLDPSATLLQTEVYREFKNWFKETFPGTKVPDSPTVKGELIAKLGKQSNKRWHGVRIVQQEGGGLANI